MQRVFENQWVLNFLVFCQILFFSSALNSQTQSSPPDFEEFEQQLFTSENNYSENGWSVVGEKCEFRAELSFDTMCGTTERQLSLYKRIDFSEIKSFRTTYFSDDDRTLLGFVFRKEIEDARQEATEAFLRGRSQEQDYLSGLLLGNEMYFEVLENAQVNSSEISDTCFINGKGISRVPFQISLLMNGKLSNSMNEYFKSEIEICNEM